MGANFQSKKKVSPIEGTSLHMESAVECSNDDLIEENRSLRSEIKVLKGHLSLLLSEEDKGQKGGNSIRLQQNSENIDVKVSELQAEISRLKSDNEALEKFNKDQGVLGKQLSQEKAQLETIISGMQKDLLRILPLQCEKEKYRKLSDDTGIALRLASEENRILAANLGKNQIELHEKQAQLEELLGNQQRMECEIAKLKDAVSSLSASLESEKSERGKYSLRVQDMTNELASQGKRNSSQAREIERQLAIIQNGKQELLILKSRLALRDEAIREHENALGDGAPVPPMSHVAAALHLSPKSRFRKVAFQRQQQLQQHTDHFDLGVDPQCVGMHQMNQVVAELPNCMPSLPAFAFLSNSANKQPRKST